jgi:rhamnosyltransferase
MTCTHLERVAAIIWTYNPNLPIFHKVLSSVIPQVDQIIIIDNASSNYSEIDKICKHYNSKIFIIRLKRNLGVEALNIAMSYAVKEGFKFLLILDQDSILLDAYLVCKMLKMFEKLKNIPVGAIHVAFKELGGKVNYVDARSPLAPYEIFSGTMINAQCFCKGLRIRKEFFLDQADFDFFEEMRRKGFLTLLYGKKLMWHKLGEKIRCKLPFIEYIDITYENPNRYYYIVRNSTALLLEGKITFYRYFVQLISFFLALILRKRVLSALKALGLGLIHASLGQFGMLKVTNEI